MKKVLLISLITGLVSLALNLNAAIYKESGGIVVVEAEHFDSRTTNSTDAHHWAIIPDEIGMPDAPADMGFTDARGAKYMQSLPDSLGGGASHSGSVDQVGIDPYLDYKVQISTPGEYRLWLRWAGYDGSSDSMYGQILELMAPAGPGPDFYRYVFALSDGAAWGAWTGVGAPSTDLANRFAASGGEVPAVWPLSAGTYTIRLSMREDGSSVDAVMLQLSSLPAPTSPGPPESQVTTTFITINPQPADASKAPGQTAMFTIGATGSGTPTFQWQRAAPGSTNFIDIAGATGTNYTTPVLTVADEGTKYRAVVSITGLSINSRIATLTVDVVSPIAYRAAGSPTFDRATVVFSEAVDPATGTNIANYTISGLTISNAVLAAGGTNVVLFTSRQTTGTVYTVTVKDIKDRVTPANVLSPNPTTVKFTGFVLTRGAILHKFWNNITLNTVDGLVADMRFPDNPDFFTTEPLFEYPPNGGGEAGSNYGNDLSGLLLAPVTGTYVFFTCSDDPSRLYLSTDEDPANKKLIAAETSWSNARQWVTSGGPSVVTDKRSDTFSASEWPTPNTITLTNGRRYYIEVQHTEGGGGDNVGVQWQLPGAAEPADASPPINGTNVFTYLNPDVSTATIRISSPADGATFAVGASITIMAEATDTNGPIRRVDFYAGANQIGSLTNSPYTVTLTNVAQGRYTLTATALDRSGFVITSAPVGIIVGTPRPFIYFVTADPGPLTFAGDVAVYNRLLGRGFDVQLAQGAAVPADGSTALGKNLIIQSSSLGSGTVENVVNGVVVGKFRNLAIPAMEWEASSQDAFGFQELNGSTIVGQTQVNIVDSTSPLAAGFPNGLVTTTTADPANADAYSQGTPTGAHIVATQAADPTQAVIYYYEKGDKGFSDFVMPARRVFFFFGDNTITFATADGLKLFDAAVDWLLGSTSGPAPTITSSRVSGGNITIQWTGGGTLESAPSLAAPITWTTTGNSTGSFSEPATGTKYYRVKK